MGPDGKRMSKSRGNVITPDTIVASHGADALRVYELFMAPFEQDVDWSTEGLSGARRFLNRIWNLIAERWGADFSGEPDRELDRLLHQTIRKVTERIETLRFNTMISALMEFVNALSDQAHDVRASSITYRESLQVFIRLLAPAAPHIADELWRQTGHKGSVHEAAWPEWNPELAKEETVSVVVQVNGKLRTVVEVPAHAGQGEVESLALEHSKVRPFLDGKQVKKIIYVQGKVLNIVVG
jgi:leucyl-tRNA synthetase